MNTPIRSFIALCPLAFWASLCPGQSGTGLHAEYFDTESFAQLKTTRTDPFINFTWGNGTPSNTALTSPDLFSVCWSGQVEPEYSEDYTFYLTCDDYARLWVNDQLVVGRSIYQGGTANTMRARVRLKAGHRVNLRVEYAEITGSAHVKLEWESPSRSREVIPTNRLYPATQPPNGGSLMREVWTGLSGYDIGDLTSLSTYPARPASRDFITSFESIARDWENNFGTRVTGYLRAPISGSYVFAVSGDDRVQLSLSTDANPSNATLIAAVTGYTGFRQWDKQTGQQSSPVYLHAGRLYYVELLHRENTGGDHWSVGWKRPGQSTFEIIPGTALAMPGTDADFRPSDAQLFDTLATEHPRLGISRERLLWLKAAYLSSTPSAAQNRANAIKSAADAEMGSTTMVTGRAAVNRIQRLALAWWLTGNDDYAGSAWTNIQHVINHGDWANGDWKPWKGVENMAVATGYDWLHPYWSPTQKAAMIDCMVNKGLAGGWTDKYTNNLAVIINSGHLLAALAVGTEDEPIAESSLATATQRLRLKLDGWAPNAGAWYEGTGYGIFTKWALGQAMPALETSLGSTFDLSRTTGLHTTAREPLTIAGNLLYQRFTFSDVGTASEAAGGWANWWARRYDAPEAFDFSRRVGNSPLNALHVPETTLSPAAAGLSPDTAFSGPADSPVGPSNFQEVVTLRENWTDSGATFVGGMGGTYSSHGMLQSGTFQLFALGQKWFEDLTSEGYYLPGWLTTTPNPDGIDRWDYYRNRAEGHNCLVVNPNANPDRIWNALPAPLINYQSDAVGGRSFAVWDLTDNMPGSEGGSPRVTRVWRGIQLLNNRKHVLIQDEVRTSSTSELWWNAHYKVSGTTVTISADKKEVILHRGNNRLWGRIIGGNGTWRDLPAAPLLSSPNPEDNANNSSFRKLTIKLTGFTTTDLVVWFVPLKSGENPPAASSAPAFSYLSNWSIVSGN